LVAVCSGRSCLGDSVGSDDGRRCFDINGRAFALPLLAFIWFKEPISEIVGSFGFHQIDAASPPGFVAFFGWLGLAAVIWYSLQEWMQVPV